LCVCDENLLVGMKMFRETLTFRKTSRKILYLCFRCSLSTSACGGFDVSIKSDFLAERYLCILRIVHNTSLRSGICILRIVVHNTYYRRAAGPIGLLFLSNLIAENTQDHSVLTEHKNPHVCRLFIFRLRLITILVGMYSKY
jgi:hypothetical protein